MSAPERALTGPEIEVAAKATRRRFTVEYKRKILREVDACRAPGAVGALLRRESVGDINAILRSRAGSTRRDGADNGPRVAC
jgi:hypothetical protein